MYKFLQRAMLRNSLFGGVFSLPLTAVGLTAAFSIGLKA